MVRRLEELQGARLLEGQARLLEGLLLEELQQLQEARLLEGQARLLEGQAMRGL